MKPYLSVIIPAYNASEHLVRLLTSLSKSTYKNFEVVIGDDASNEQYQIAKSKHQITDNKRQKAKGKRQKHAFFSCSIVRLTRNRGPAAARNAAAKKATGHVLVFLDADVQVYPDTLGNIAKKFKDDGDLTAVTGVWDKHQSSQAFFPQFKALRDWSYWTNERDRDGYYYLFSTRIAAIKREVFVRLGGFNEVFRQMEDVELTYRIAKRYAIIFTPDVRVHHEFEGFWPVARKYFWRSYYWTRLYKERRKFDPVATTFWESMAAATGVGALGLVGLGFLFAGLGVIFNFQPASPAGGFAIFKQVSMINYQLSIVLLLVHIFMLRKFLRFVYKEKGFVFMLKALGAGLILYCVILAGSLYFQLRKS